MRFLGNYSDPEERVRVSRLLEAHGIPTFEQGGLTFGEEPSALFVCVDVQYDDAVALLSDDRHEVRRPVDVEAYQKAARFSRVFRKGSPQLSPGRSKALVNAT